MCVCEELGALGVEKTFCVPDVASTSELQSEIKTSKGEKTVVISRDFHLISSDTLKANWAGIAQSV